ncbi:MAG TPA: EamA family transporter [Candidatus Limnocylindrales bacterium]
MKVPGGSTLHAGGASLAARPGVLVLAAFAVLVVFGGSNAIGVRFVLREMGPFWSAAIRFAIAGGLLAALVMASGRSFPRGERLLGSALFGIIGFGLAYLFLYEALRDAPAGTTMVILSIVPLLTSILASAQGVERLRRLGLAGAAIASLGIVVVAADQVRLDVPAIALVLLVAAAVCQAESGIVVKRFPPGDPVAANAVGMVLGAVMLAVVAIATGETLVVPLLPETWLAMAYLIGPGSIAVFLLVLFILARWTASATSYAFLLFPLVAIVFGGLLLGETVQPSFVAGGAIVLAGVYLGAVYRRPGQEPVPVRVPEP